MRKPLIQLLGLIVSFVLVYAVISCFHSNGKTLFASPEVRHQ